MSLLSCPDGPPCQSGSNPPLAEAAMQPSSTTASIAELSREVRSSDYADVWIVDSENQVIGKYKKTLVQGSIPAKFAYKLPSKARKKLTNHLGAQINISIKKYNCITGDQIDIDLQAFLLVE